MAITKRVLIIDGDPDVTRLLKHSLAHAGFSVDATQSPDVGLAAALSSPPDVIILDIELPVLDGREVLRRLRAAVLPTRIMVLTGLDSIADEVEALDCGADDYLRKPFAFEVLLARLHALLRWMDVPGPVVLRFSDVALDTARRSASRCDREIFLTNLEYKLLQEFLRHPNQVLPKDVLLERVWEFREGGSNVVQVYVKQLRRKLEASGERRLIHTVHGMGYVLREA